MTAACGATEGTEGSIRHLKISNFSNPTFFFFDFRFLHFLDVCVDAFRVFWPATGFSNDHEPDWGYAELPYVTVTEAPPGAPPSPTRNDRR